MQTSNGSYRVGARHYLPALCLAAVLPLLLLGPLAAAGQDKPLATPAEVWAGFDPRSEPLEVEVKKKWTEHDANYTEFYFTGLTRGDTKVRVYAVYAAPVGGKRLPGVMHIHGGGQTVNLRWLRFWTQHGYAALTFNWGGEWPDRAQYTLWGSLKQGNHRVAGRMAEAVKPSVRDSSWYLWARVSRRALTALEQQPEVDPNRLGIFGVSMGGTIVWPFAAMDSRVKAACAIYGVGWNTYPDEMGAPDPKAKDPDTLVWREAMEPEAYAHLVTCPVLFLDSTNDQHGKMDWSYRTLDRMPGVHRRAFTPRARHHIAAAQGKDLPLWMDTWLKQGKKWPGSPVAEVGLGADGVPMLTVKPDGSQPICEVELFYAVENRNPKNRFWRSALAEGGLGLWSASLPVLNVRQPVFAFANVTYGSGVSLTSNLVSVVPVDLGKARATDTHSAVIDDFSQGVGDWVTRSPATDPIPPVPSLLRAAKGPDGRPGITVTQAIPLSTHKVGDPKWRGPEGASLQFQVAASSARKLRVIMHEKEFAVGWKQYAKEVALEPTSGWRTVRLVAKDFTTDKGEPLAGWQNVQQLELTTERGTGSEPVFTLFQWVK